MGRALSLLFSDVGGFLVAIEAERIVGIATRAVDGDTALIDVAALLGPVDAVPGASGASTAGASRSSGPLDAPAAPRRIVEVADAAGGRTRLLLGESVRLGEVDVGALHPVPSFLQPFAASLAWRASVAVDDGARFAFLFQFSRAAPIRLSSRGAPVPH